MITNAATFQLSEPMSTQKHTAGTIELLRQSQPSYSPNNQNLWLHFKMPTARLQFASASILRMLVPYSNDAGQTTNNLCKYCCNDSNTKLFVAVLLR